MKIIIGHNFIGGVLKAKDWKEHFEGLRAAYADEETQGV